MKSTGIPFERICDWQALFIAWRIYCAGKRRRPDVAAYEVHVERNLLNLARNLSAGSYRHGPYQLVAIHDPKARLIAKASVRDRIVHTALHRALAPEFQRAYIGDTYACLPGRGTHRARLRFLEFQRKFEWLTHLDIQCFFPNVKHHTLQALLAPHIRDQRYVRLIEEILRSGDRLYRRAKVRRFFNLEPWHQKTAPCGLPIGNLTSQWWGNQYLDGCDHFIKRELKVKGYLRYMDDMVLFDKDRVSLRQKRAALRDWLLDQRGLRIHQGPIKSARCQHTYLGCHISRSGMAPSRKAIRRFQKNFVNRLWDEPKRLRQALVSWHGHFL